MLETKAILILDVSIDTARKIKISEIIKRQEVCLQLSTINISLGTDVQRVLRDCKLL